MLWCSHAGLKYLAAKRRKGFKRAMDALVIIPARMGSARLPGKPLADIAGQPMIVHVLRRAEAAECGPVYVACAEAEIYEAVMAAGGRAVMTDPDLPSGSDRVRAAAHSIDPDKRYDVVINVQGDMPTLDPDIIQATRTALGSGADIATAAVETSDAREINDPNVVKVVISAHGQALYFSRAAIPTGGAPIFHHVGIYAYRRTALEQFCDLPPTPLEISERLEQLRALEAGMRIDVACVDAAPHGVDTPEDLQRAIDIIEGRKVE